MPALEVFEEAATLFPDPVLIGRAGGWRGKVCGNTTEPRLTRVSRKDAKLAVAFDALASMYIQTFRYEDAERCRASLSRRMGGITAATTNWRRDSRVGNGTGRGAGISASIAGGAIHVSRPLTHWQAR